MKANNDLSDEVRAAAAELFANFDQAAEVLPV